MARIIFAVIGATLAVGLSPVQSRAEFDPSADAHRVVQAEAEARKAARAAAAAPQPVQVLVPVLGPVYEPTYGEWLDATAAARNRMILWMGGAYSGLAWSDAEATRRGAAPIFCPPPQMTMTGQIVMELVAAQGRGAAQPARSAPLGAVVVSALKSAFPCRATP